MIALRNLTKKYGVKTAVDDLSLDIRPGKVTGFLGPNGAGKSTTMRMIAGLDHSTAGQALINGRPYSALRDPLREVGALLDADSAHPARSARAHLLALARSSRIADRRVDEVLELTGLSEVAGKRAGGFSLGMRQRLGIAAALLGDPAVLLLDEPVNGLDPDGVRWIRDLMRSLAAEGRTVFVSSHLMSEMQHTADHLVVLGKGRLITDAPLSAVIGADALNNVRARTPQADELAACLTAEGYTVQRPEPGELVIFGGTAADIGDTAHRIGVALHELGPRSATLEAAYLELTGGAVEYAAPRNGDPTQARKARR